MDYSRIGILLITGILFLSFFFATAADPLTEKNEIITIGAIYNLEGSQAPLDIPSSQGAILAGECYNQVNQKKKVEIILADGKSDPTIMRNVTRDLIDTSHCQVIIGLSDTDMVIPAAETAAADKILFVTSGATSPQLPSVVPDYLYLACFGDNAQAAVAAEYAAENLTARTAAVYYDATMNYTALLANYFKTRFLELGGEVTQYSGIKALDVDLKEEIESLSITGVPDIIFLAVGPDDAPRAIRIIRESGIAVPVIGGDSYDTQELLDVVTPLPGRVYYTTHAYFLGEDQIFEVGAFKNAYQQRYNATPDGFAGLGYDTVNLVLLAVELSGTDGDIRDGLSRIQDYQGVTGLFSYTDSTPIPKKSVTLMQAGDGTLVRVGDFVPANPPAPFCD